MPCQFQGRARQWSTRLLPRRSTRRRGARPRVRLAGAGVRGVHRGWPDRHSRRAGLSRSWRAGVAPPLLPRRHWLHRANAIHGNEPSLRQRRRRRYEPATLPGRRGQQRAEEEEKEEEGHVTTLSFQRCRAAVESVLSLALKVPEALLLTLLLFSFRIQVLVLVGRHRELLLTKLLFFSCHSSPRLPLCLFCFLFSPVRPVPPRSSLKSM
mmetsp:Transcript_22118/g.68082  ORF Transcript_22118/g.68082 Transcript_22118/m.68082 type:complete len:210 (-) Transcript_22118:13-642(-)